MADEFAGKTLRWTFDDGPTAGRTYEHVFGRDGTVRWHDAGAGGKKGRGGENSRAKYQATAVSDGVVAVSYLAPSGYTLTSILDLDSGAIVAFASNETELYLQHGTFEEVGAAAGAGGGHTRKARPKAQTGEGRSGRKVRSEAR